MRISGKVSSSMRKRRISKIACRVIRDTLAGIVMTIAFTYAIVIVALPASMAYTHGVSTHWVESVPEHWPTKPEQTTLIYTTYDLNTASMGDRPAWMRLRQGMHKGTRILGGTVSFYKDQLEYGMDQVYVGWPFYTMTHRGPDDARPGAQTLFGDLFLNGVKISNKQGGRFLPLMPIWRTFIPNVLVFALIFEILLFCRRLIWKRIRSNRSRRGLCPECQYPLKGLNQCPECGTKHT